MRRTRVILLVHPQDENRATLQVMLKRDGYGVIEAEDVMGAVEQIRESVPDLVLTAMRLRGGSGSELIRTIRSDASYPRLKVVALGAEGGREDAESAGADAFEVWPATAASGVIGAVKRLVGRA